MLNGILAAELSSTLIVFFLLIYRSVQRLACLVFLTTDEQRIKGMDKSPLGSDS